MITGTQVVAIAALSIRNRVKENRPETAPALVKSVLSELVSSAPCPSFPKLTSLVRTANRRRLLLPRPNEPKDLTFNIETLKLNDRFFKKDIQVPI